MPQGCSTPPAGKDGPVKVDRGHLVFKGTGGRARFFGIVLLPTLAFPEPERCRPWPTAWRGAGSTSSSSTTSTSRSAPGGASSTTTATTPAALDPVALARFDHLVALLKERGIYITFETDRRPPVPARRQDRRLRRPAARQRPGRRLRSQGPRSDRPDGPDVARPRQPRDRPGVEGRPGPGLGRAQRRADPLQPPGRPRRPPARVVADAPPWPSRRPWGSAAGSGSRPSRASGRPWPPNSAGSG